MTRRHWLAAACALLVMGCASSKNGSSASDAEPVENTYAVVQNDYMGEIEVFTVIGTIRNRLGRVATGAKGRFIIPPRLLERPELQFQVTPSAATMSGFTYQPIAMNPGSTVELHVNRVLANSTYQVIGHE